MVCASFTTVCLVTSSRSIESDGPRPNDLVRRRARLWLLGYQRHALIVENVSALDQGVDILSRRDQESAVARHEVNATAGARRAGADAPRLHSVEVTEIALLQERVDAMTIPFRVAQTLARMRVPPPGGPPYAPEGCRVGQR